MSETTEREDTSEVIALMGRYCDGDGGAFHALYARLAPRILGYLTSLAGDRATAEDLLQQVFMKLHEARSVYVRDANPVPWIYTIAHRTCLDELRRRKRALVRFGVHDAELPEVAVGIAGGRVDEVEDPEREHGDPALALKALELLPANQRAALVLTKVHGRTQAEAASILGTSVGAIKLRAHRGYVALRRHLAKSGSAGAQP
jgi:RNA polymerase sigma-70 factor (ECF subfamily)